MKKQWFLFNGLAIVLCILMTFISCGGGGGGSADNGDAGNGGEDNSVVVIDDTTPLCFTALKDGSTVKLDVSQYGGPAVNPIVEYSSDGINWNAYTLGTVLTLVKIDDKVYFRGDNATFCDDTGEMTFVITGKIQGSGNIMSLVDKTMQSKIIPCDCCFDVLFEGCDKLTRAPALPATTLTEGCYYAMFRDSGLTAAPALPATTLADSCYERMFKNCTSLTTVPSLPATTLTYHCYCEMFSGCSNLAEVPELRAETLVDCCYDSMFYDCASLTSIKVYFTDWNEGDDATTGWVDGVGNSGTRTFYYKTGLDVSTEDGDHVPAGWTKTLF